MKRRHLFLFSNMEKGKTDHVWCVLDPKICVSLAKSRLFCTNHAMFREREAMVDNGITALQPTLMLQLSDVSSSLVGVRKEYSGLSLTCIEGNRQDVGNYFHMLLRLRGLNYNNEHNPKPRKRSNSLPIPKIEVTAYDSNGKTTPEKLPNISESKQESGPGERYFIGIEMYALLFLLY